MNLSDTSGLLLTLLPAAGYLMVLAKLGRSELYRTYSWFTVYIAFQFVRLGLSTFVSKKTSLYAYTYYCTEAIFWLLCALVILELFNLVLNAHAGIRTLGRHVMTGAILVSTLVSGMTLFITPPRPESSQTFLENFLVVDRVVNSSLAGVLLILLIFMAYFPVPVNRNTLVHAGIFSVYFLAKTGIFLSLNLLGQEIVKHANVAVRLVSICCLFAWAALLTNAGDVRVLRSSRRADPEDERRLVAQLNAINATLLRSARK